jgi:hypothetical protein
MAGETMYLSSKDCGSLARRDHGRGPQGRAERARKNMNEDVADGLLVDVREVNIADLDLTNQESTLFKALNRILTSNSGCNFNSFGSSI